MITPAYCQEMARYNQWQNQNLLTASATLTADARGEDRGAFFGSIEATFFHLLWGDTIWMSRFDGWQPPAGGISDSSGFGPGWEEFPAMRLDADRRITDWAGRIPPATLDSTLTWYSGAAGCEMSRRLALCITHFFNHQTHHRGQIHAMLTAAGARPGDTDLALMPVQN